MNTDEIASSLLGNVGLLAATLGVLAAIRVGAPKRNTGTCQSCGGRGVKECTLCYGKGFLVTQGYVNFADPRHRRLCRRCEGSRIVECSACGVKATHPLGWPSSDQGNVRGRVSEVRAEANIRRFPRTIGGRIKRSVPAEQYDDDF